MKTAATILVTTIVVAVLGAVALDSRVQSQTPQWEYLTLSPGSYAEPGMSRRRFGYGACQAAGSRWNCRRFEPKEQGMGTTDPLNEALFTLGQERWELMAVFDPKDERNRMAYVFKRRVD